MLFKKNFKKNTLCKIRSLLALTAFLPTLSLSAEIKSHSWQADIAPYLWALSMDGEVQSGNIKIDVSQSFSEIMKHFQGGGMLWLNLHKEKFGIFINTLYSVLKAQETIRSIPIAARNNFGIFSAGISYQIFEIIYPTREQTLSGEIIAGARYTLNDTKLSTQNFSHKSRERWTDPLIGLRFVYNLDKKWQGILAGNVGGMNGHHSYDLQAFIGYSPVKKIIFVDTVFYLGYRFLHQNINTGSGVNFYAWNMDIKGPVIGVKAIF